MEKLIYGLLGRKLGHSWSPMIHAELGNPDYRLIELEPEELESFLKKENIGGLNVTIPYKLAVMPYCRLSPEAEAIGAVNTIVNRGGELWGYNTDQDGFKYMVKKAGIDFTGKKVIVLGSGGASRTAVYCAEKLGAESVTVISRSGEDNYGNIAKHADCDIIVNCTPVGMYPNNGASPVELRDFRNLTGVVDVIYNPHRTKLVMDAEDLGIPCTGGLSMLTAQAKRAAELFFDSEIPDGRIDRITDIIHKSRENIVLIGMPGSGKSAIGEELGRITGRTVKETDTLIGIDAGKSIPAIFAEDGEENFRALEHETICRVGKMSGTVIVTGGGVVTRPENYAPLRQNGRIYEITRGLDDLAMEGRPLSKSLEALKEMYKVRKPMYERFRDREIENDAAPEDAAMRLWRDFCEADGD
ncbi:MAG: shikimate kinase [Oscillospiraceae bacterium]|nr:shikimate kinase [Oscillospiraceae bacterium]